MSGSASPPCPRRVGSRAPGASVPEHAEPRPRALLSRIGAPVALLLFPLGACSAPPPPPPPAPTIDAEQEALAAEHFTQLDRPMRVIFGWSVREPGLRTSGRGVARLEPPYRARLDLFTGNGETVLRAALVGDDIRIPPGSPDELVPPPALLWSALGVFRPGDASVLLGGQGGEGRVRLRYGFSGGVELRYVIAGRRVESVDLLRNGQVADQLVARHAPDGRFPSETTYRDLAEFRELKFTLETVEDVEAYPPDIWSPNR